MSSPHIIRLRGPWELERDGESRRTALPCPARELGPGFALLRRRFGRPPIGEVSLRLECVPGLARARLNGRELALRPDGADWVADGVGLEVRNLLEIEAEIPPGNGEWGVVSLLVAR